MKLVVGLGNPGRKYAGTRHNLGYDTVDCLAERWGVGVAQQKFSGLIGRASCGGHDVVLLKPTTFMNVSGESVLAVRQFYKLSLDDMLVVLDDLDLPAGCIRVRAGGSSGGHKGLADIVRRLGCDEISRIRIGIGSVGRGRTIGHVLSRAGDDEAVLLARGVETAADAADCWIRQGTEVAMNRFNGQPGSSRPKKAPRDPEGPTE